MKNYVAIVSVVHFLATSNKDFCIWKGSTKLYYYHRDMIDFYLSCTTNSGTLLSAGPFAEITLSMSVF